jgi:predicted Zn-dependent protease with MMP-like domain
LTEAAWKKLLEQAQAAWQQQQHHDALQLCDRAALVSSHGRYAAARLRGDILLHLGDAAGALSSYDSVADPALADARLDCSRGLALFELVRFPEAHGALRSALRGDPQLPEAHHALGVMAEILGTGDAAEHFRRARRLAPARYAASPHLTVEQFQAVVQRALERLPERLRTAMQAMTILVQELPRLSDLQQGNAAISPLAFGTQVVRTPPGQASGGPPEEETGAPTLLLFKRNLERACADETELVQAIRDSVLHEAVAALGLPYDEDLEEWPGMN